VIVLDNYSVLYNAAASLIPQGSKVVELGCGSGKFAADFLRGFKSYKGYDLVGQWDHIPIQTPGFGFAVADITKLKFEEPGCTFVALEVFEHLFDETDLQLLLNLPRGSRVVFSVPSFDSADHKRFFPNEDGAIARYNDVLDIDFWRKIRIPTGGGYFHLMRGYR
jgi:SAM-dependent methyltransferase